MDVFKDQWEKQVRILTEAVDDITSVDDFLSVSGTRFQPCLTHNNMIHQLTQTKVYELYDVCFEQMVSM